MSMAICEDRHEQVVYEDWDYRRYIKKHCPVCEVLDREAVAEERIKELEKGV